MTETYRAWYYDWTGEMTETHRAWYYDWTGELSNDPEGNLCWLCDDCASELGDQVSHASEDDLNDSTCWRCGK